MGDFSVVNEDDEVLKELYVWMSLFDIAKPNRKDYMSHFIKLDFLSMFTYNIPYEEEKCKNTSKET